MTALNLAHIDTRQIADPQIAAANDPAPVKLVMPSSNDADIIPDLTDLAAGPRTPQEHGGEVIDITEKLRQMIQRVIEFLRSLFAGKEAKPA